jgi:hypothetical protein
MSKKTPERSVGRVHRVIVGVLIVVFASAGAAIWWSGRESAGGSTRGDRARAAPSMGALEAGVNRQGRDLSDLGSRAQTAAQCAAMCLDNDSCRSMSFSSGSGGAAGICWLKSAVPEATPTESMISSVKVYPAP